MVAPSTHSTGLASAGGSRYYVLQPLATGGMATVELALQVSPGGFERLVALKRVKPHLASSEEVAAMFGEESRIAARLNHPNLIHAYEVGQDAAGAFLAMEYLSGQSYESLAQRVGLRDIDLRVVLEALIATLDGLECVHGLRDIGGRHMALVHRDVSPSNLFITYTGQVKLLDFGIAKARLSSIQTQVGVLKGKVSYMAPEQATGGSLDARADLYAVGVMLWEALAGQRRWGDIPEGVLISHLVSGIPAPSPRSTERGLPPLAEAICAKALSVDPAQRFQSAAEFRSALDELATLIGPRMSPRTLSDYVIDYFAVERAQAEQQVERSLADLVRSGTGQKSSRPSDPGTRSVAKTRELAVVAHSAQPAVFVAPSAGSAAALLSPVASAPRPKRPWLLGGATLALGLGSAAAVGLSLRAAPSAAPAPSAAQVGAAQVGAAQVGAAQVGAAPIEVNSAAMAPAATRTPPAMPAKAGSAQDTSSDPRPAAPKPRGAVGRAARPKPALVAAPKKASAKGDGLDLDRGSPW